MRRRFIISLNEESAPTVQKMISLLNAIGSVGWWHYMKGTWLVIDASGTLTARKLREQIMAEFPGVHHMVFEIAPGGDWSGLGPEKMRKWLEDEWEKPAFEKEVPSPTVSKGQ